MPTEPTGNRGASRHGLTAKALRILRDIKSHLEEAFGDRVRHVILYGSQARGDASEESDLDVAIVVVDDLTPMEVDRSLEDILLDVMLEEKELVSVVILKESMYTGRSTPLIKNIKREGIIA